MGFNCVAFVCSHCPVLRAKCHPYTYFPWFLELPSLHPSPFLENDIYILVCRIFSCTVYYRFNISSLQLLSHSSKHIADLYISRPQLSLLNTPSKCGIQPVSNRNHYGSTRRKSLLKLISLTSCALLNTSS